MCKKIVEGSADKALGYFRKGNEPPETALVMSIVVAPCECGERMYARTPNGVVWVEAERDDEGCVKPASLDEERALIDEVA